MIPIPLSRPDCDEREVEAVRRVLESGRLVQGPEVEAFEDGVARAHGARHCIAVSSGTAALHVAYLALGIGPGDTLFVPSFAWPSAAHMAMAVGARPVFVDVLPRTYNMDPADLCFQIERSCKKGWGRARAVVPVHQFGLAAEMDHVLKVAARYEMEVIEDAACALGATCRGRSVGTLARLGIFSFHPRKAVTTGEGGALVTNDDGLADRCRRWRDHGQELINGKRDFGLPGMNYRMTEIQAAVGRVQLAKLPRILKRRKQLASRYLERLADSSSILLPRDNAEHTWQTFMIVLHARHDRACLINKLDHEGICARPGSIAGHCTTVYRDQLGYRPGDFPVALCLHSRGLALPLFPSMQDSQVARCADVLAAALKDGAPGG